MTSATRPLSLAAGTAPGLRAPAHVAIAAPLGYDAVGFRFDVDQPTAEELAVTRRRLDDTGLTVLAVEVVRIRPGGDHRLDDDLIAWGHAVGARHLVVASDDADRGHTIARFAELCRRAAEAGMLAVLEFAPFTAVRSLADAVAIVGEAGGGRIVVDALHLARSGGTPAEVGRLAPDLLAYVQLSDAPAAAPTDLAHEARHARLRPGTGRLPLRELLGVTPDDRSISVEVPNDAHVGRLGPEVAAAAALATTRAVLEQAGISSR